MNKAYGIVLKYYRKKAGLSQSDLCENICVPSYLSKIENGDIKPSNAVMVDFFKKLNMTFDEHAKDNHVFDQIIDLHFNLRNKEAKALYDKCTFSISMSPSTYSLLAVKYFYEGDEDIKAILKSSLHHLPNNQASRLALMIYDRERKDNDLLDQYYSFSGYGNFLKGNACYDSQSYRKALTFFKQSESLYLKEGMLNGMFHAIKHQGVIYSLANRLEESLRIFERLFKMANEGGYDQFPIIHRTTHYNVHYIKYLLKQENNLKAILEDHLSKKKYSNSVLFHMLAEIEKTTDPMKAKSILEAGMKEFDDTNSWNYQLLKIDLMILEDCNFVNSDDYYDVLKQQIDFLYKDQNFLTYHMRIKELVEYLKKKRRYKEALELTEQVKSFEL